MNKLGLRISYGEIERIDLGPVHQIINTNALNRTPVQFTIDKLPIIHGAMKNFKHERGTLSEIGTSHDVSLILFQKRQNATEEQQKEPVRNPPIHHKIGSS